MRRLALWFTLLLCAPLATAQGFHYVNNVIDQYGRPVPNPTIRVCGEPAVGNPCNPLASGGIFSDVGLTQPLPNPFTGDQYGNYNFFVATGTYHVQISGVGVNVTDISYINLGIGTGSLTSVGFVAPTGFTVTGSPVTGSGGTLTLAMPAGWTTGSLLLGTGANTVGQLGIGPNGSFLGSNGTTASWQAALPSGQIGDTIRYNVNGDGVWDATNAAPKYFYIFVQSGSGIFNGGFGLNYGAVSGVLGTLNPTAPTANDNPGFNYSNSAGPSTNTVIGVQQGASANSGAWGFQAFYRWTHRFAAGNLTNVRYWTGLTYYLNGTSSLPLGNASFATNTPNQPFVGFRFAAGTDASWQAVVQTSSASQTLVSTGVAIDLNPHTFEVAWTGSSYVFFIDHAIVATISTNIPSASLLGTIMFWCGDNESTNTTISGTFYHMMESLK